MSQTLPATHQTSEASQASRYSSDNAFSSEEAPSLFTREELRQFAADDAEAGRRIGKILAALFIYTIVAMSVAIWWSFRTIGH